MPSSLPAVNVPRKSSEVVYPTLFKLENMSPEKWRALMIDRVVDQKDMLVGDIKSAIIKDIDKCLQDLPSSATAKDLHTHLINSINSNEFNIEYQKYVESIVGATFEYVCQFIIQNSMDNIKRTQQVLKSLSNPTSSEEVKKQNDNLQESLEQYERCYLLESNDENKYEVNVVDNAVSVDHNNDVPIAQCSSDIEETENKDANVSRPETVNCNTSLTNSNNLNNSFNEHINMCRTSSPLTVKPEDHDSNDEDENVNGMNGLKILEKLVSIEHSKLENIKCPTVENNSPPSTSSENKQGELSNQKISKEEVNKITNGDMSTPNIMGPKTDRLGDKRKSEKENETDEDKVPLKRRKNNSEDNTSIEIIDLAGQIDQNISPAIRISSLPNATVKSQTGFNGDNNGNVINSDTTNIMNPIIIDITSIGTCNDETKSPAQIGLTKKTYNITNVDLTNELSIMNENSVANNDGRAMVVRNSNTSIYSTNICTTEKIPKNRNQRRGKKRRRKSMKLNHGVRARSTAKCTVTGPGSSDQTSSIDTEVAGTSGSDQLKTVEMKDNIDGNEDLTKATTTSQDTNTSESNSSNIENLPSKETNTADIPGFDSFPYWLKLKCQQHNIKPVWVDLEKSS